MYKTEDEHEAVIILDYVNNGATWALGEHQQLGLTS